MQVAVCQGSLGPRVHFASVLPAVLMAGVQGVEASAPPLSLAPLPLAQRQEDRPYLWSCGSSLITAWHLLGLCLGTPPPFFSVFPSSMADPSLGPSSAG